MLGVMRGDRFYENFDPWDAGQQTMRRFSDYADENYDRKGTVLHFLGEANTWVSDKVQKPLGIDEIVQWVYVFNFFTTITLVQVFVLGPWHLANDVFMAFSGHPTRREEIFAEGDGDGMGIFKDFFDNLMRMSDLNKTFEDLIQNAEFEKNFPGGKITTEGSTTQTAFSTEQSHTAEFR